MIAKVPKRALGRPAFVKLRQCVAALGVGTCLQMYAPSGAWAADAPSTEQQRRESAKGKYQLGVEAYRGEHFADAVRLFLEADALSPSAALSYNIARAYDKLADDAQTLRWYRNYLRLNPTGPYVADVQKYVRALSDALAKKGIQQLTMLSTPAGATVAVDGTPLGVTPLTVELRPGEHTVFISERGYMDASSRFTLPPAQPIDLALQLEPAAPQTSASPGREQRRRFGIAPYLALGVSAAFLGASAIFEAERRSAQSAAKSATTQLGYEHDYDSANSRKSTARVLLGVGGAAALTGGALLVFNSRLSPSTRASITGLPGGTAFYLEHSF